MRLRLPAAALLIATVALAPLHTSSQAPRQADVEAAYLFNFAKFLRTPSPPHDVFLIGVLGKSPLFATLTQITAHEQVDGKPLRIVHVESVDEARRCDMLYVGETDPVHATHILEVLSTADVLTVSDQANPAAHAGMIQFVLVGSRVRFTVNLDAVHRTHIQLSSELLKVALTVNGAASAAASGPASAPEVRP